MRRLCAWLSRVGRRLMKVILHAFQQTHWERQMEKYRLIVSFIILNSFSNSIIRLVLLFCYKILRNTLIFDVNSSFVSFRVFLRAKEFFFHILNDRKNNSDPSGMFCPSKTKQKISEKFTSEITCFETVLKCDYYLKTAPIKGNQFSMSFWCLQISQITNGF